MAISIFAQTQPPLLATYNDDVLAFSSPPTMLAMISGIFVVWRYTVERCHYVVETRYNG